MYISPVRLRSITGYWASGYTPAAVLKLTRIILVRSDTLFVHEYIRRMISRCSSSRLFYIRHGGRHFQATFATAGSSWRTLMSTSRLVHNITLRRVQHLQVHRLNTTITNGYLGFTTNASKSTNSNAARLPDFGWRVIYGGSCGLRIPLTVPQRNRSTRHPKTTQGSALVRQSSEKTRLHTELGEAHRADQRSCWALDAHFREACVTHHTAGSIGHATLSIKYVIGAAFMAVPDALLSDCLL